MQRTSKKKKEFAKPALRVIPGGIPSRAGDGGPSPRTADHARFEALFENANDAILVVDLKRMRITSANHALLELTGYLREEVEGQPVSLLYSAPLSSSGAEGGASPPGGIERRGFSAAHVRNSGFFEDVVLVRKDGYPRFVSMSVRTLKIAGLPVAMCILRDVTEKKNMERDLITKHTELRDAYVRLEKANAEMALMQETLVQSGKLAALGELAAGIAHELNQPLTAVKGFAQEAHAVLQADGSDARDIASAHIHEVLSAAGKMQKIIAHLRNFSRKSTEDFEWVDVHSVIEESLVMLDKQLKSRGIVVERQFQRDLPKIYCNPFQIEQVFINLATNARDAIEAKKESSGRISIATSKSPEGMVVVRYEDNGMGIPENVRSKIFNPFFTTKEVGKGMGLGLSISYGILSRINASILVESSPGKGSVFTVKLPVDYRKH